MKLGRIYTSEGIHLAVEGPRGWVDLTAAGARLTMDELIAGADRTELEAMAAEPNAPVLDEPHFAAVTGRPGKLICVGLNYRAHARNTGMAIPEQPVLFSKFADALTEDGSEVSLPPWEDSYDYEAELVIVIGRGGLGLSEEEAPAHIFGYSCGNDISLRSAQLRSGQWLIGKTLPGFAPVGPCIVTADSFDPHAEHAIRSYVNSELRQNGTVTDMIFSCERIVSYASHYIRLEPGDLIFTGTPSGVALEGGASKFPWLKAGDSVEIEIEGIGRLRNRMVQG